MYAKDEKLKRLCEKLEKISVKIPTQHLGVEKNDKTTPIGAVLKSLKDHSTKKIKPLNSSSLNLKKLIEADVNKRTTKINGNNNNTRNAIDVSDAIEIQPNTQYDLEGFTAGYELFLKLSSTGLQKLTTYIEFAAVVDIETYIFTVDANYEPTIIAISNNLLTTSDIASCLMNANETYYVIMHVNSGGGDAAFAFLTSSYYSGNEPNDSLNQAPLRHDSLYFNDTFDNPYDLDVIRLQITTAVPMALIVAFNEKNVSGVIKLGIYHAKDINGNPVGQWVVNQNVNVPTWASIWNNTAATGEFYIFIQYQSGNVLNKPYALTLCPVNSLPTPNYIDTGTYGITGNQYGYVSGHHWVMGSFQVVADFTYNLAQNADGFYPCFPTIMTLIGLDDDGEYDFDGNSNASATMITQPDGLATISALLPYSYGQSGSFSGYQYSHDYDENIAVFQFLHYESGSLVWRYNTNAMVTFNPFWNVSH